MHYIGIKRQRPILLRVIIIILYYIRDRKFTVTYVLCANIFLNSNVYFE